MRTTKRSKNREKEEAKRTRRAHNTNIKRTALRGGPALAKTSFRDDRVFDYTYEKSLYDRLLEGDSEAMRLALARPAALQARMVHFVGNHDEARAVAAFGPLRSLAAAAAGLLTPGARLVHHGQLAGWRVKMPVQLGRLPGEATDVEVEPFYQALLAEAHQPMYHDGIFTLINGWSEDILVCAWALGNNWRLIVLNYTNHPARTSIALPAGLLPAPLMPAREILSGASTTLEGGQLELALLPAFGVQIWRPR